MNRILMWFWLLNKRLYKKISFLLIMALIPLAMISLSAISAQDSGFLHIALAQEDAKDPISAAIIDKLQKEPSLIRYTLCSSPEQAQSMVRYGKADAAWLFPQGMEQKIQKFSAHHSAHDSFITVLEREDSLFLRISHEKLTAALYPYCAKARYLDIAATIEELEGMSDAQLMEKFETVNINESLFAFADPEGNIIQDPNAEGYLLAPARGFMGLMVMLCGLAAAMYFMQDIERGTFGMISQKKRGGLAFLSLMIATLNIALVVFFALWAAGLQASFWPELAAALLFAGCCAVFALLLMRLLNNIRLFGALIPFWLVLMLALCPVFFDFRDLSLLQHLLPPTYFINVGHDPWYLLYMMLYIAGGGCLCLLLEKINVKEK